jgi:proline dehydrogenase
MKSALKTTFRPLIHAFLNVVSRNHLLGATLDDAIETCIFLQKRGYQLTLGYWNSANESPPEVVAAYHEAITRIRENQLSSSISIKAWAFNHDRDLYKRLVSHALSLNVPIHHDSHLADSADATFKMILEDSSLSYNNIGCTLPARWKRSSNDTGYVTDLGINVRVVKGQVPDPHDQDIETDAGYIDIIGRLAGTSSLVEVATHNYSLIERSLDILKATNTKCEIQLLYGLPVGHILPHVKDMQVPVRMYVPYGDGWLMYVLSSIFRNPKVVYYLTKELMLTDYKKLFPILQPLERIQG